MWLLLYTKLIFYSLNPKIFYDLSLNTFLYANNFDSIQYLNIILFYMSHIKMHPIFHNMIVYLHMCILTRNIKINR